MKAAGHECTAGFTQAELAISRSCLSWQPRSARAGEFSCRAFPGAVLKIAGLTAMITGEPCLPAFYPAFAVEDFLETK